MVRYDGPIHGVRMPVSRESLQSETQPSPRKVSDNHSTPVVQRKTSVSDLISRLTASTASSRSKRRDKNETPSPSPGPSHNNPASDAASISSYRSVSLPTPASSPSLFHRLTFGHQSSGSPPKRLVISRPIPAPPPDSPQLLRARGSSRKMSSNSSTIRSVSPATSEKSMRSIRTTNSTASSGATLGASSTSGANGALNAPTPPVEYTDGGKRVITSQFATNPRPAPQRPRITSGPSSLNRPSPLSRSTSRSTSRAASRAASRQRTPSSGVNGKSRVVELKEKIVELERALQSISIDERVAQLEAELETERTRRIELELHPKPADSSAIAGTDLKDLVNVRAELKTTAAELETTKADLESTRQEFNAATQEFNAERAKLQAAAQEKTQALDQFKTVQSQLEQEYEKSDVLKVARDNLEWQVKGLQVSHRTLEQQLVISQRDARRCRRTLSSLETKVKELQVQLEEKNLENDELTQTIDRIMRAAQHYWRNGHNSASENESLSAASTPDTPQDFHSPRSSTGRLASGKTSPI